MTLELFNIVKDVPNFPARRSSCPPSFLSAVFVAEWRTGGPAHQVVKNEDTTPLFFRLEIGEPDLTRFYVVKCFLKAFFVTVKRGSGSPGACFEMQLYTH